MSNPPEVWFTTKTAAEYLGVTVSCMRSWVQTRKIAYTKLHGMSGRIRIEQRDLDACRTRVEVLELPKKSVAKAQGFRPKKKNAA